MLLKCTIVTKAVVTEQLRQELADQYEAEAQRQHQELATTEKQAQDKIRQTQLHPQGLEPGMQMRKQWEHEKQQRLQQIQLIEARRDKVKDLKDGQEIVVGQLESLIDVVVGDRLREKAAAEIVLKDGVVVEIRGGGQPPALRMLDDDEPIVH